MEKGFIIVIKVKYSFKDGTETKGLEFNLAPKVKKFIPMNRDNCELLKVMDNGLLEWYNRAEFGDDVVLYCYTGKDKLVTPNDNSVEVNFK